MKKDKFNAKLREYSKTLSPTTSEQDLVNKIYKSFNDLFGTNNCIQIGSYPRFTSVTPIHDLDILYILGAWNDANHSPSAVLQNLFNQIKSSYTNPTTYTAKASLQTHSVTVDFTRGAEVILSVDIVPAYSYSKNEFGQDTYKLPEVIKEGSHLRRKEFYAKLQSEQRDMSWINSDPRGYIKMASDVGQNSDFRKTVKFIKRWKSNLCDADNNLKLKSFHIEQVVTKIFQQNPSIDIFDAVFAFFYDFPATISTENQISDRANSTKYIDDYLAKFTPQQVEKMKNARDGFLIKLENMSDVGRAEDLLKILFYKRASEEEFLFDRKIPTHTDPQHVNFTLTADVTDSQGNVQRRLNSQGVIDSGRYLRFNKTKNVDGCSYHWKVKNDNNSEQPRGEITPNQTKNIPEHTKYRGTHYVECYAIQGSACIASARHNVVLS